MIITRAYKTKLHPTDEQICAAVIALSTPPRGVTRAGWDAQKPVGYPSAQQIQTRFAMRWGKFISSIGLLPERPIEARDEYIRDEEHYRARVRALSVDKPVTIKAWDAQRQAGEFTASAIAKSNGCSWSDFVRESLGLQARNKAASDEEQQAIIDHLRDLVGPDYGKVEPLRVVGEMQPRRYYCWRLRQYVVVNAAQISFG